MAARLTDSDRAAFLSVLEFVGEDFIRQRLQAGNYRGKKWEDRLPVIREWLAKQEWRRVARLN